MKCHDARRLFGSYWDDETTQAEREWLESHFATCAACRREYEELARVLETVSSLPRHEASPELLERTLAHARRAARARDAVPERRRGWVPVTAAAALLFVAALISQWPGFHPAPGAGRSLAIARRVATLMPAKAAPAAGGAQVSAAPDTIFDHSDDIEFVLDPVTLRRGRATVVHPPQRGIQTQQAVVSF